MKKYQLIFTAVLCGVLLSSAALAQDNEKRAQTGFKFLNVATDPRAVGMGEAVTAIEGGSSSMFFNPAAMARMTSFADAQVGQTNWIADIKHIYGSIAFAPSGGDYGVLGFTFQSVDYGEILATIRNDAAPGGFQDVGNIKPKAMAVGIGYARALSDRFSVGGNVRYTMQDLGGSINTISKGVLGDAKENKKSVAAFDFGMYYKTGIKSLDFAVSIRNFSTEVKYERESFQLPLIFRVGLSFNMMDLVTDSKDADKFVVSVDATHPRDFSEQINVGGEYVFMKILALRAGYMFNNDEYGFTAGAGVKLAQENWGGIGVDYSYTKFTEFGNVNRLAVSLSF
ncbi:MAG: PorV/PorQ family protein [Acidobacteriota bacterium]